MEKTSMLVIVTPDGVSHGQRLTDSEAVELTRRLLELRDGPLDPEPAPRRRRPGGGRPRKSLTVDEAELVVELRRQGMAKRKICERYGLPYGAVFRAIEDAERAGVLQKGMEARNATEVGERHENASSHGMGDTCRGE